MLKILLSACVNGLLGVIGVITTVAMSGQPITTSVLVGAGLTGLTTALKDAHAVLQEPPI